MTDHRDHAGPFDRLETRIPPPVLVLAIGAGMAWAGSALEPVPVDPVVRYGAAGVLIAVAGLFGVPAVAGFRAVGTTVDPVRVDRATTLVTEGVYRRSRNPMYVAMVALLTALAVVLAVPAALAGPVLFVAWITRFQIRPEERVLARRFGATYEAYRIRVRRWI